MDALRESNSIPKSILTSSILTHFVNLIIISVLYKTFKYNNTLAKPTEKKDNIITKIKIPRYPI
jgi:hypothetical protein